MSSLRVQVDSDVADALQVECELLGFEGPESYLAWIVENRAAIEQGTESTDLLAAYRERLVALEARLSAEGVDPDDIAGDVASAGTASADAASASAASAEAEPADSASADAAPADATTADSAPADDTDTTASGGAATVESGTDEASAGQPEPGAEPNSAVESESVDSEPADSVAADSEPADSVATDSEPAESEPGTQSALSDEFDVEDLTAGGSESAADVGADAGSDPAAASDGGTTTSVADITSMHLRPERVQRVNEDPVARDAIELADVETRRVEELSRTAVAKTREQLDRDVETGLSYSSSTAMPGSDVRPGEDVTDLDALDVPGRSEDVVADRREVVGRALAFLRDEERARRSDIVEALYEAHPTGYETADGWWRCVREGLEQVEAVEGGHVWTYVG